MGLGIGIIIAIIVGVILLLSTILAIFARMTRASRGGVQPPPDERDTRGTPPIESVEHRS